MVMDREVSRRTLARLVLVGALGALLSPAAAQAQESHAELAKKLSNPVASLVSIPLQYNWAQGVGPDEDTRFILNVQPVVPFSVGKDWNMIMRVIMPFMGQPALGPGLPAASGLGDILASFFLSPKQSSIIWGVGPAIGLPTTAEPPLGLGQFTLGPTGVILKQVGPWTFGTLAYQVWSIAGSETRADVSQMYVQPFLSHTSKSALTVSLNSESTLKWKAASGQKYTIPINLAVSKMANLGQFPASYGLGGGYYVETPDGGPEWQLRGVITILLPQPQGN